MDLNKQIIDLKMSLFDTEQLTNACNVIVGHLGNSVLAIHLYGSALEGGLKPCSDIDLFVTVKSAIDDALRRKLMEAFLHCSAYPGTKTDMRALEVTVVNYYDVVPWRYPARRELQFGEWLREDILKGVFEPAQEDIDLTILLRKLSLASIPLIGKVASEIFEPIPEHDFKQALYSTLSLWQSESDWQGDERNIILTIARIWYSIQTGQIVSKEEAATWLIERIPLIYKPLVIQAKQNYLATDPEAFTPDAKEMNEFIYFAKQSIENSDERR